MNDQPLDLSKKELTMSVIKDSDTSSRNTASPCGPKEDVVVIPPTNPEPDDLEDSPLVIDEETTDSAEVRQTLDNEVLPKVSSTEIDF